MGIVADIAEDWHAALAALSWQVEAGVDEVILDAPVNRYALAAEASRPVKAQAVGVAPPPVASDPVAIARAMAAEAQSLAALRAALAAFDHCELKKGARNLVFADGSPAARVLVLGEAPGAEEDREGRPFVGRAGQLLDRMFAAIGLSRTGEDPATALYITNVLPWRPPGNRDPEPAEIAMLRPFVERHIALVDPAVIVVMGNTPLDALTGQRGILRARGTWMQALDRPVLPMTHPAYLLRNPAAKREAWADLLALQARLNR
ncbi:MAG: uracil-DNA glycosylase [Rhodobacterales bacterium 32-66-7]|nr:MAG: uracil-DNA glycosylase [Rhodobacterales bacterium 32-66-7]